MHADEVATGVELVRELLTTQFAEWASLPIEPVTSTGTDNALYRLGVDKVIRLPRRREDTLRLEKERRWLPRLAPLVPLSVPVPLAKGSPGEGYPFEWSIYRWLDGEAANLTPIADLTQAAAELAEFVLALQRIDSSDGPPPGTHNAFRGEPLAARDESTRGSITALREHVDADAVTAIWDDALTAPDWTREPVWIHGDLDSRNLLVANGRLSAVIDFGCLGVGDPACDVMVAWKVLSADARDVFRTKLSVDDATWMRSRGWALSQAVNALSYYTPETNPALVREGARWLDEVLADAG